MKKLHSSLYIVILLTILLITIIVLTNKETVIPDRLKCFVINLNFDENRLYTFKKLYNKSDISKLELNRFEGINGKTLDNLELYVDPRALSQLKESEKNGYRLKHYEITLGAVGCYLSHLNLYKELLEDNNNDYYLIFEDDAYFSDYILYDILDYFKKAPIDWDLLIFGAMFEKSKDQYPFKKYEYFWGLNCYMINKKGAEKIIKEYNKNKIKMQIDSMMSLMAIENRINIYGSIRRLVKHNKVNTNIQLPIKYDENIDPFSLYI
jgi:GR25 family glycosyltransferase involved in LPS biosynthesis